MAASVHSFIHSFNRCWECCDEQGRPAPCAQGARSHLWPKIVTYLSLYLRGPLRAWYQGPPMSLLNKCIREQQGWTERELQGGGRGELEGRKSPRGEGSVGLTFPRSHPHPRLPPTSHSTQRPHLAALPDTRIPSLTPLNGGHTLCSPRWVFQKENKERQRKPDAKESIQAWPQVQMPSGKSG